MRRWSEEEMETLRENYPLMGKETADLLDRSEKAVQEKANRMGIERYGEDLEEKALYYRALGMNLREIAERTGVSHGTIYNVLKENGVDTERGKRIERDDAVRLKMPREESWENDTTRSLIGASHTVFRQDGNVDIKLDKEDFVRIVNTIGDGKLPSFCKPMVERKERRWKKPYD